MTVTDEEFERLSEDVERTVGEHVDRFDVRRNENGPWSRFAEVPVSAYTRTGDLTITMRNLEEKGYVCNLRGKDRSVLIDLTVTYDVFDRLGMTDD